MHADLDRNIPASTLKSLLVDCSIIDPVSLCVQTTVTVRHGGLVGCDVLTLVRVFEEGSCHQQPIPLSLHTRMNEQDNTVSVCELEVGLDSRIDLAEVLQRVVAPAPSRRRMAPTRKRRSNRTRPSLQRPRCEVELDVE
jgi:hypothetical protein